MICLLLSPQCNKYNMCWSSRKLGALYFGCLLPVFRMYCMTIFPKYVVYFVVSLYECSLLFLVLHQGCKAFGICGSSINNTCTRWQLIRL